jgi:hypothetical protein
VPSADASGAAPQPSLAPAATEPAESAAEEESPVASEAAPGGATLPGSPPPLETSPVSDLDPAVAAGLAATLIAVLIVTVLVLRRGRSGVGL